MNVSKKNLTVSYTTVGKDGEAVSSRSGVSETREKVSKSASESSPFELI